MSLFRLAVLVSGGGSNLQVIIDGVENHVLTGVEIPVVISSESDAFALSRGKNAGIDSLVIEKNQTDKLVESLRKYNIHGIVLAGYLPILDLKVVEEYRGRIINIHPSLIPKFCGKGFHGRHVHKAVIESGEKNSGATVHFVDEGIDTGSIILQKSLKVHPEDTPETLGKRVLEIEHEILIEGIRELVKKGRVDEK